MLDHTSNVNADTGKYTNTGTEPVGIPPGDSKPARKRHRRSWFSKILDDIKKRLSHLWERIKGKPPEKEESDIDSAKRKFYAHLKKYCQSQIDYRHNEYDVSYSIPFGYKRIDNPTKPIRWLSDLDTKQRCLKIVIADLVSSKDKDIWNAHLEIIYGEINHLAELSVIDEAFTKYTAHITEDYKVILLERKQKLLNEQTPDLIKIRSVIKGIRL